MILKLTRLEEGLSFLVDTAGLLVLPCELVEGVKQIPTRVAQGEWVLYIKETIEEIEQQIKEGGITNGTN